MSDNFDDNVRDTSRWNYSTIQGALYSGMAAWDPAIPVIEQNQRLEITPRTNVPNEHYNGYVLVNGANMTNARAVVEAVQVASGVTVDTELAVCVDSQNFYLIVHETDVLYFQQVIAGNRTSVSVPFDAAQHRWWRIRHILSADTIVFETSPNGQTWTVQRTVPRQLSLTSIRAEISAGTWRPSTPGTAIFDNFKIESNVAPTAAFPSFILELRDRANALANAQNPSRADIQALANDIQQARALLAGDWNNYALAPQMDAALVNALSMVNRSLRVQRQLARKYLSNAASYLSEVSTLAQA